jgi:hypothetical protein
MDPDIALSIFRHHMADPTDVINALCYAATVADLTGHGAERDGALELIADLLMMRPRRLRSTVS